MKVLGLVVEYNPLHNGHLYHIRKSLELTSADYCVCVMSGNFIQRGEPAIINKWARTKAALLSGIDLVIELPVVFAMASAEFFAYGAIKLLDSLGVVDYISFGSENGNINELAHVAEILADEPPKYKEQLKGYLDLGCSFPVAREKAILDCLNASNSDENLKSLLGSPNNILGLEYLKALKRLGSRIVPFTITRIGSSYNSPSIEGTFSSATSIRNILKNGINEKNIVKLSSVIPAPSLEIIKEEFDNGRGPVMPEDFGQIILSLLRRMTLEQIAELPYVAEGFENRIKAMASECGDINKLVELLHTKRYTATRIQRILFHVLTGLKYDELKNFMDSGGPQYIRVLGFNNKGRELLSLISRKTSLPLITKTADYKFSPNKKVSRMLEIEASSSDIYVLAYSNTNFRYAGQEFTQNVIKV